MKKIYFTGITFTALLLTLFIWSCNKQDEVVEPENNFTEITIPDDLKANLKTLNNEFEIVEDDITFSTQKGQEIYGKIRITFPTSGKDCTVLKIELSKNLLEETNLDKDFFKDYYSMKSTNDVADCMLTCEKLERGRFWCKATCIITAIIDAAVPH